MKLTHSVLIIRTLPSRRIEFIPRNQEFENKECISSLENENEIMKALNLTETRALPFVIQYNLEASFLVITILNSILIFPALVGNCSIVLAIKRTPVLQTPSNLLLCSLAVSDICVGLIALPLRISRTVTILLKLDDLESKIHPFTLFTSIYLSGVSVFTITTISVDRFLSLYLHLRYAGLVTSKRILVVILKIWIFVIPFTFTYHWKQKLFQSLSALATAIMLMIVVFCYFWIYKIVRRHQRQIQSLCNVQPAAVSKQASENAEKTDNFGMKIPQKEEVTSCIRTLTEPAPDKNPGPSIVSEVFSKEFECRREKVSQREDSQTGQNNSSQLNLLSIKKTIVSSFYVCILFFICSFPYLISKICLAAFGRRRWTIESNEISVMIIFFSSALNPFIYCTKMRSLRTAVYKIYRDLIK